MSEIRVDAVEPAAGPAALLHGAHVDAPAAGYTTDLFALDVAGWVLGRQAPVAAVELIQAGTCLWRVPVEVPRRDIAERFSGVAHADRAGFFAAVGTLALEPRFELLVRARLEDKTRVPIATIRGERTPLRTEFEPRLQPLMITTLGRTGSTALVRMLGSHPAIAAYRPFEFEPRVASYWMGVLRTLAEPASHRRQIAPSGPIDGTWWAGLTPPHPRRMREPELDRWLSRDSVQDLAVFCQSRIDGLYARIAAEQGKEAAFFVEKQRPDFVPGQMWELYPNAREVILARDFRDMVSSMFAFNEKRGFAGFRRGAAATDVEFVQDRIGGSVAALDRALRQRAERAHLVRYEDLVTRPAETARAMLDYLGLEPNGEEIQAMADSITETGGESDGHRTVADPARSIGRWQTDLSPELRVASEEAFGEALERFGYERGATDGHR